MTQRMTRLAQATLTDIAADVARPGYARDRISPGIVHLGLGAFARAHLAVHVDDCLPKDPTWGIVGASLRKPEMRDALVPQDGLYTLAVRDSDRTSFRVIGAVMDVVVAIERPEALLARMAAPEIRIVSLTVTEKGYCRDPATGRLDTATPEIVHDIAHSGRPRSAPGYLVAALARRRTAGLPPFTVLCCDNLPGNGDATRRIVLDLADAIDPSLARWVEEAGAFPNTMVDRIVPATTDTDRAQVETALGLFDAWPVVTEPFSQWVIEDRFACGRPALERVGAMMVECAEPFERMKLRLLNGAHSAIAYLGVASGVETVVEAMAQPGMRTFLHRFWAEAAETLDMPQGFDVAMYTRDLEKRFENRALRHLTVQIARDGSQKLPQRLLGTVRDRLAADRRIPVLALAIAAWMRHVTGRGEDGRVFAVEDPLGGELAQRVSGAVQPADIVRNLVSMNSIFGDDLASDRRFLGPVTQALDVLCRGGTNHALALVATQ